MFSRLTIILLLALLSGRSAFAGQLSDARIVPSVEMEAGVNFARLQYSGGYSPASSGSVQGYRGAVNFVYGASQRVACVFAIAYDQRGSGRSLSEDLHLFCATTGVSIRLRPVPHRFWPYLSVGPEIGIPVGASAIGDDVASPLLGLRLGLGGSIYSHVTAGISYTLGLTAVGTNHPTDGPPGLDSAHHRVLGLNIGVSL